MRVFIVGATGVLGQRVVARLVDRGHKVVGLSRSKAKAKWLTQHGAVARAGDLFDRDAIIGLTDGCEAILHLATAIPTQGKTTLADWEMNDRLRREGTRILVDAAIRSNCKLYLQQSILLLYGEHEGEWVNESSPLPDQQPDILQSALDMENIVQEAVTRHDLSAITLRFGSFYSHDSAQTQAMFQLVREGHFPIVGDGRNYQNNLHVGDAAEAISKAVEKYAVGLGRTFNVCDDEPVQQSDVLNFVADVLGEKKPAHISRSEAEVELGSHIVEAVFTSFRCKNNLVKDKLEWAPRFPTYREGYRHAIDKWLQYGTHS